MLRLGGWSFAHQLAIPLVNVSTALDTGFSVLIVVCAAPRCRTWCNYLETMMYFVSIS